MPICSNLTFLAAGVALACLVQPVSATTLQVGTCTNNPRQYATIQDAVTAANSGDKVQICPGSYPEEVTVAKSLTLENVPGKASPVVTIPAGGAYGNTTMISHSQPAAAQILVAPATPVAVNVENLIVDGSNNNIENCTLNLLGIYYQNAYGKITGNTAQNQQLPPDYQGCQSGNGIYVENQTAGTQPVKIENNTVTNFDKNGIVARWATANTQIENNNVTGVGPTTAIAQNGIELAFNASGTVSRNTVSGVSYSGDPENGTASGILLYDLQAGSYPATPVVSYNTVTSAQSGIVLDAVNGTSGSLAQIKSNSVSGSQYGGVQLLSDGVDFDPPLSDDYIKVQNNTISGTSSTDDIDACSDNDQIKGNTVGDAAEAGIHLDGTCTEPNGSGSGFSNAVSSNQIENNCVGILSGPPPGSNTISNNNTLSGNTNNYIYGQDTYTCTAGRVHGSSSGRPRVSP